MALALYRKYRPRTFAEVIGQEHVTEPLCQALRTGRLNHAYLFSGPRGCGKTSSARILARSLNCEKGPTPEPCGECDSCVALAPDGSGSIDVIEIDAASHGGVDDARDLRERAFFAPVSSRFKVYVIDEAHMVSSAGFNALLKLVEEPPDYVKFIFATTEPEKVLGTIKSRTHHYPFRLIPPGTLRPYLEQLCQSEGVTVEPPVFPLVVRAGGGSARDSLSVLDQLIAGAGAGGVTYARAVALLGVTDSALIDEMCDALGAGDGASAFASIHRVVEAGHDPRRFASDLLDRLRDLIILQRVPDAAAKGLLDCPADQLDRMAAQAARLGTATLSRLADIVHDGLTEMRGTTAPRLLLELICARMLLPAADNTNSALLQRLEAMERRLGAAAGSAPHEGVRPPHVEPPPSQPEPQRQSESQRQPEPQRQTESGRQPESQRQPETAQRQPESPRVAESPRDAESQRQAASEHQPVVQRQAEPSPVTQDTPAPAVERPAPGALDAAAIRRMWDEILSGVRGKGQRAWAVIREAAVHDVDGNTLILTFRHSGQAGLMSGPTVTTLTAVLGNLFGGTWQVRWEVGGGTPAPQRSEPPRSAPASESTRSAPQSEPSRSAQVSEPTRSAPSAADGDWPEAALPGSGGGRAEGNTVAPAPRRDATAHPAPTASAASAGAPDASGGGSWSASSDSASGGPGGSASGAGGGSWSASSDSASGGPGGSASGAGGGFAGGGPAGSASGSMGGSGRGSAGGGLAASGGQGSGSAGGGLAASGGQGNGPPGGGRGGAAGGGAGNGPLSGGQGGSGPVSGGPAGGGPGGGASASATRSATLEATRAPGNRAAGEDSRRAPSGRSAALEVARQVAADAARQAASGARTGARQASGDAAAASGSAPTVARPASDAGWEDEPPFDPEYDGPAYTGFDPGDEPSDDDVPVDSLPTGEDQILRMLAEHLGAEQITDER